MPNYFLVKSEPYVFSFANLQRDGRAMWDGVRNFEARNNLRAMQTGDLLLFYHSNEGKAVVGVATVVTTAYADPTADPARGGDGGDWSVVDVAPVCALKKPVSLDDIRAERRLAQINLLRRNRLSVVPVTPAEFALILQMGETTLPNPLPAAPRGKGTQPAPTQASPSVAAKKTTTATAKKANTATAKKTTTAAAKKTTTAPRKPVAKSAAKSKAAVEKKPLRAGRSSTGRGAALALLLIVFGGVAGGFSDRWPMATAWAEPPAKTAEGKLDAAPLLDARLVDLEDRAAPLRSYVDKPAGTAQVLVVLHQDRKSADENQAFKTELGRLSAGHPAHMRVVALADVDGYAFWPAKGYVKDALRPLATDGAVVLCDWRGAVRKSYGLKAGQSAVFVLSPSGELVTLSRGKLTPDESKALLRGIRELLPPEPATP